MSSSLALVRVFVYCLFRWNHDASPDLRPSWAVHLSDAVEGHLAAIRGAIMVHRPALLLLEQSDGLRTHHPGSYQQFNHGLRALGYDVYHCVHSSGVDDSCAHERVRLLWACRDRELL